MYNLIVTDVDTIHKSMLDNISDDYSKDVGTFTSDFLRTTAIGSSEIRKDINTLYSKLDMSNYSGSELDRQVKQKKGLTRKAATFSTTTANLTGTGSISVGDIFETEYGVQFRSTEDKIITGNGSVGIEAVIPGSSGNVGANSVTLIPVTIPGITDVNNSQPATGGYDEETDQSLFERYLIEVQKPSTSGNVYHYMKWSREVPGVGYSKIFPLEYGNNTVGIIIADDNGLIPGQELIDSVQEYIDPGITGEGLGEAPIGAYCTVSAATAKNIDIAVTLEIDKSYTIEDIKEDIETSVAMYLKTIIFTGKSASYAIIGSLILDVDGVNDWSSLTLNGGQSNIGVGEKEIAILNSVIPSE